MDTRHGPKPDPRNVPVQISFRVPFWYREHLTDLAKEAGVTLPVYVASMLQRQVRADPPRD